jgi:uncharacterized protein YxeA
MNIRIDNDYKLTSDERNVILTKISIGQSGKSKGKAELKYFGDFEHALNDYLRIKINTSQATSINELKAEIREVKKTIQRMMEDE